MNKTLGFIALLTTAILFGSAGIYIRYLNNYLSLYQQLVLRNSFALLLISVIVFSLKQFSLPRDPISKLKLFFFSLSVPISVILVSYSVLNLKIGIATFTYYCGLIIFSIVIGTLVFKEKITILKSLSATLSLAGLYMFLHPITINSLNPYILLGILSGMFGTIANYLRKDLSAQISRYTLVLFQFISGVLVSLFTLIYLRQSVSAIFQAPQSVWFIAALFGGLLVLASVLLVYGLNNTDLSIAGVVLSAEIVSSSLFGYFILNEVPTSTELWGGVLIFLAVVFTNEKFIQLLLKRVKLR